MWEWMKAVPKDAPVKLDDVLERLILAFLAGAVIAATYRFMRRRAEGTTAMAVTLILLTVLITLIIVAIGDSAARAFSLVGVLSIVRFRAPMEDIRDTAFVVFAVAAAMTLGTGLLIITAVAVPLIALMAIVLALWEGVARAPSVSIVNLKVAIGFPPEKIAQDVFARFVSEHRLLSVETAKQGTAIELKYRILWRGTAQVVELVSELSRAEGVQSVELRGE